MVVDQQRLDDEQAARTDRVFHALADPTRRDIVRLAMQGEHSVSALARRYPMSFAAVQKHVAVLVRAELVSKRRSGREQLVRGRLDTVRETSQLLDQFAALWRDRIERFGEVLLDDLHTDTAAGSGFAGDTAGDNQHNHHTQGDTA